MTFSHLIFMLRCNIDMHIHETSWTQISSLYETCAKVTSQCLWNYAITGFFFTELPVYLSHIWNCAINHFCLLVFIYRKWLLSRPYLLFLRGCLFKWDLGSTIWLYLIFCLLVHKSFNASFIIYRYIQLSSCWCE